MCFEIDDMAEHFPPAPVSTHLRVYLIGQPDWGLALVEIRLQSLSHRHRTRGATKRCRATLSLLIRLSLL